MTPNLEQLEVLKKQKSDLDEEERHFFNWFCAYYDEHFKSKSVKIK